MKRVVIYAVIFFQLLVLLSLSRGLVEVISSRRRVDTLVEKRERLLADRERLKGELSVVESEYYIEKVARDQLHLSRPGESLVIVPEKLEDNVLGESDGGKEEEKEIWEKWLEVLFGEE